MLKENLAAVLKCKGDLQMENIPIPSPGKNEVLLAMHSVGICGSDVHYWINGRIGDFIVKEPMVLGHEASGTVVQVGEGVKNLKPGDRVAVEPGVPCRYCESCKTGRYNLCPDVLFCATPPIHGNLARYYVHAADFCYKLPDHVTYEEGAMLEPLSVAVHACRRANVSIGDKILITGCGPIGLMNLLTAKAMGASTICMTDMVESRLEVAKSMGANSCVLVSRGTPIPELARQVEEALGGQPNITIECSGAEASITLAINATKPGGLVLLVGMGPPNVTVPLVNAACKEVDIRGIFRYANCYPLALSMVASGQVNLSQMVTHRFKLEESLKAFETAQRPETGAIKVIINCEAK